MSENNPLLSDDPETTAMRIRSLLSLAEMACDLRSIDADDHLDGQELSDRMHGAELAIRLARQAVSWLGEDQFRREPTPNRGNVSQMPGSG